MFRRPIVGGVISAPETQPEVGRLNPPCVILSPDRSIDLDGFVDI